MPSLTLTVPGTRRTGEFHRGLILALLVSIGLVFLASGPALAAPADLDPTFDGDGKVTTDFGGTDVANALALQADGKVVVGGTTSGDFALARYNTDGSLDTNFGTGGKVITDLGGNDDAIAAIVIQTDGRVVVAGWSNAGGNYNWAVARYTPAGILDPDFGTGGVVTTDFGGFDVALGIALQSNRKIVVVGQAHGGGSGDFAIGRYDASGDLDPTFGTGGIVTTNLGPDDTAAKVAIQEDGKLVVAGITNLSDTNDFALVRYNPDGSLDATFGTGGIVTTNFVGADVARAVTIQNDGKIVVAGDTAPSTDWALARYNTDGSLDTNFGTGGKVITDLGGNDQGHAVALQSDGKIVMGGYSDTGGSVNFALARFDTNGSLDTTFDNGDGIVTTDFGGSDVALAIGIHPNGKIHMAGYTLPGISANDWALARYEGTPAGPTKKDQCKHGGWRTFTVPHTFKNQGDCVSFVQTGK